MKNLFKKLVIYVATASVIFTANPFYVYADEIVIEDDVIEIDDVDAVDTATEVVGGIDESYIEAMSEEIVLRDEESDGIVNSYIESPRERQGFPVVTDEYASELASAEQAVPSKYITDGSKAPLTRDQNPFGTCWSFAAIALSEFDALSDGRGTVDTVDNSELHLEYYSYCVKGDYFKRLKGDGLIPKGIIPEGEWHAGQPQNFLMIGGNYSVSTNTLANWIGTVPESVVPYTEAETVLANGLDDATVNAVLTSHLQQMRELNIKGNPELVKQWIVDHGAVGASYNHKDDYYNAETNSYYNYVDDKTNHAIAIVGWDDDYPASNFSKVPSKNGAWLIRNSWDAGKNIDSRTLYTYFWISYDDTSLNSAYGMDFEAADNYDNIYAYDGGTYYDGMKFKNGGQMKGANVFTAEGSEEIAAIGTYVVNASVPLKIYVYTDLADANEPDSGTLQKVIETTTTNSGYYTFKLSDYGVPNIKLTKGSKYSVVIEYGDGADGYSELPVDFSYSTDWYEDIAIANAGESFFGMVGDSDWLDCCEQTWGNVRIKAFTNNVAPEKYDYSITYVLNGGTNSAKNPAGYNKNHEAIKLAKPTRKGYTFKGWYKNKKFTKASKISEIKAGVKGNLKLYAKWEANTYKIKFNSNGGQGKMSVKSCVYGKNYKLDKNKFTKKGYKFVGWATSKANAKNGKVKYKNSAKVKNLTEKNGKTVTLYAVWKKK